MSKRNSSGDAVRRAQAAQIKKPFPWGTVAGAVVLVLFLGAIMVFAVKNTGANAPTPLKDADKSFPGLLVAKDDDLGRDHADGIRTYKQDPPVGGDHNKAWQNCAIYGSEIPKEHAVHSMEHGAVWITYQPGLPPGDVDKLAKAAGGQSHVLLSPYPGLKSKVSLQAWGRQLAVSSAGDDRIERFVDKYAQGPQTPERGALCSGGVSVTGNIPQGGAGSAQPPQPQLSPQPNPAPSAVTTFAPRPTAS